MKLVNKEDEIGLLAYLGHDALEPVLKLPAVLRPRDHGGNIHRNNAFALQGLGHAPVGDALAKTLHYGGLTHSRLSDETGVVLSAAGQNADDPLGLFFPPDDGVQLAPLRHGGEIPTVLRQGRRAVDAGLTIGLPLSVPASVAAVLSGSGMAITTRIPSPRLAALGL